MNRECRNCANGKLTTRSSGRVRCWGWPEVEEIIVEADHACEKWRAYNEPRGGAFDGVIPATRENGVLLGRIEALEANMKFLDARAPEYDKRLLALENKFYALERLFVDNIEAITRDGTAPSEIRKRVKKIEDELGALPRRVDFERRKLELRVRELEVAAWHR